MYTFHNYLYGQKVLEEGKVKCNLSLFDGAVNSFYSPIMEWIVVKIPFETLHFLIKSSIFVLTNILR